MPKVKLRTILILCLITGCLLFHWSRKRENIVPARLPGRIFFAEQPDIWSNVIKKFVEEADLVLSDPPLPGGMSPKLQNNVDGWTVEEAIEVINEQLVVEGYQLILRDRLLFVLDVEGDDTPRILDPLFVQQSAVDRMDDSEKATVLFSKVEVTDLLKEAINLRASPTTDKVFDF